MSENILEHTTSITGLTCKPLAILSETISPREMNRARGGDGMGGGGPGSMSSGQNPDATKAEQKSWQEATQKTLEEQKPPLPGLQEGGYVPDYSSYNFDGPGGEGINPIGDAFEWAVETVSDVVETGIDVAEDIIESVESDGIKTGSDVVDQVMDLVIEAAEDVWDGLNDNEDDGNCEYCDDENCDGDCGHDDDNNGSGVPDEENSTESTEGNNG